MISVAKRRHWLVSPRFDLGWFVVPGLAAAALAVPLGLFRSPRTSDDLALWIAGVLLVDVAHVWSSLYRTWLDPQARRLHARLLRWTPVLAFAGAFVAYALSPRLFWGALAYLAVFHFIKQQIGFVAIYLRAGDEHGPDHRFDRGLARAAVWVSTAGPVLWWHTRLPREFAWFVSEDFQSGLPPRLGDLALLVEALVLLLFFARRLQRARRSIGHPMVPALVAVTALCWNLGIVVFNDDRVFTLTNVVLHGVPYLALVWVTGGRERVEGSLARRAGVQTAPLLVSLGLFYGLVAALAFVEEAAWDWLIWHEHAELFGPSQLELGELATALAVALLSLPQITHYLLDRWIWRVGPRNPRLAGQLGFATPPR